MLSFFCYLLNKLRIFIIHCNTSLIYISLLEIFKALNAMRVYSHSYCLANFCTINSRPVPASERWKKLTFLEKSTLFPEHSVGHYFCRFKLPLCISSLLARYISSFMVVFSSQLTSFGWHESKLEGRRHTSCFEYKRVKLLLFFTLLHTPSSSSSLLYYCCIIWGIFALHLVGLYVIISQNGDVVQFHVTYTTSCSYAIFLVVNPTQCFAVQCWIVA